MTKELYVGGTLVDLGGDQIALNFSMIDFENLDEFTSATSFAFNLPRTRRNDEVFRYLYDLQIDVNDTTPWRAIVGQGHSKFIEAFNRNERIEARYVVNGQTLFDGFLDLEEITDTQYQCALIGGGYKWAPVLNETKLRALTAAQATICHNFSEILLSWARTGAGDLDRIVFPFVDYGNLLSGVSTAGGTSDIFIDDIYPAWFCRRLFKDCFAEAGYDVVSNFWNKPEAYRLILLFSNEAIIPNDPTKITILPVVEATRVFTTPFIFPNAITIIAPTEISLNDNNSYNLAGTFTPVINYFFCVSAVPRRFRFTCGFQAGWSGGGAQRNIAVYVYVNGVQIIEQIFAILNGVPTFCFFEAEIEMKFGDVANLRWWRTGAQVNLQSNADISIEALPYDGLEGLEYNTARQLPDITALEFVKGLMKAFNLYVHTDETTKTVYVETHDDFFLNFDVPGVLDWTRKIDYTKPTSVKFIDKELPLTQALEWESDDDFLNAQFQEQNGETVYGTYEWTNKNRNAQPDDNDYTQEGFSPTLSRYEPSKFNQYFIATITDADSLSPPDLPKANKTDWDKRLAYYRLIDGASAPGEALNPVNLRYDAGDSTQLIYLHPQAFFWLNENEFNPEYYDSLRFDDDSRIGLFRRYFERQYLSYNSGRIFNASAALTDLDISALDFRRPIRIENQHFRLNKVENYQSGSAETTSVELLHFQDGFGKFVPPAFNFNRAIEFTAPLISSPYKWASAPWSIGLAIPNAVSFSMWVLLTPPPVPITATSNFWGNATVANAANRYMAVFATGQFAGVNNDISIRGRFSNGFIHVADGATEIVTPAPLCFPSGSPYASYGRWVHLCYTRDDALNRRTLYVNGIVRASSVAAFTGKPSINELRIGADTLVTGTTRAPFAGKIDDFRYYLGELDAAQVAAIYNAGQGAFPASLPPLICYYKFDETSGIRCADASGNFDHAILRQFTYNAFVPH